MVKKGDEELEVPDGLKGRIFPFELVQQQKFQAEMKGIESLQSRMEAISGELASLVGQLTGDEYAIKGLQTLGGQVCNQPKSINEI